MNEVYPRLTGHRVRPLLAPLEIPHKTVSGTLEAAPLLLIDVKTSDGVTGSAYLFSYTPTALDPLAQLTKNILDTLVGVPAEPTHIFNLKLDQLPPIWPSL